MIRNWRRSSYSSGTGNGNCVEVALGSARVGVRDSKNVGGPVLGFAPQVWRAFTRNVR